jgi:hypothetical protein
MTNQLCRDFLLVLDIIEVAKLSLQVTECGDEGPVSLTVLASSKSSEKNSEAYRSFLASIRIR